MTIEEIKKQLVQQGLNPEDYCILLEKNGYQIWKKEVAPNYARFATQEDKPIKTDVDITAETVAITLMDMETLAETVVYLMEKVEELEGKLNG